MGRVNANDEKQSSVRQRGSISSRLVGNGPLYRAESHATSTRFRSNSNLSADGLEGDEAPGISIKHPVEARARTAMLPPVLNKNVDDDPLCWLEFTEDSIMTSCTKGQWCSFYFIILPSKQSGSISSSILGLANAKVR